LQRRFRSRVGWGVSLDAADAAALAGAGPGSTIGLHDCN
jgi:hypothetical protein